MGLIKSHDLTSEQRRRCCRREMSVDVVGHALYTMTGQRAGQVRDALIDDESLALRYLVVDTRSAEFPADKPYVLLPADLCRWDEAAGSVRCEVRVDQVQAAPEYDPAGAIAQDYEATVIFDFGERPSGPAQL